MAVVDALGAISLRVAASDGEICEHERRHFIAYFVDEWGIDKNYAREALATLQDSLSRTTLEECVRKLAGASVAHPDCKADKLRERLFDFIEGMVNADGKVCKCERDALEEVRRLVSGSGKVRASTKARKLWQTILSTSQG